MDAAPKSIEDIVSEFERRFSDVYQDVFPARATWRMENASEEAWQLAEWAAGYKEGARQAQDEVAANMLLSAQCMASAIASELSMWLALRTEDPDRAWTCLIDMQDYLAIADRAHSTTTVTDFMVRAAGHEVTLFPPVMFLSPEFRYRSGRCSVCGDQFDQCPHEEDGIYMGRLCRELDRRDVSLEHVAIVKAPRDKRCRLVSKDLDDGKKQHWFSGDVTTGEEQDRGDGRSFGALIHHLGSLKNV